MLLHPKAHAIVPALLAAAFAAALLAGCATAPTTPGGATSAPATATQPPTTREFHMFTGELEFNETQVGIPHDVFVPDLLVADKGDTVLVHYHNLEDPNEEGGGEHHTFTMAAPYPQNLDVAAGDEANVTILATQAGIFPYICTLHQPTMSGYLVVLGS